MNIYSSVRIAALASAALIVLSVRQALAQNSSLTPSDTSTSTIHAATMIDGKGAELHDVLITVHGSKIERVEPNAGARARNATYELGSATVLPGLIDAHIHPGWYINSKGILHNGRDGDTPVQSALARAGNLYATLMAGFTTVESVGGNEDFDLREAIDHWQIPGPRLLTSLRPINSPRLTPDSLRGVVRALKAQGADLIKVFASADLQSGGQQSMSDEQLAAICGEAKAQGLRTLVHAISAGSVRASTLAGCTEIEHGIFATDAELKLMADHGTIFDPQVCLVFQNYLDHSDVYGRSGYTDAALKALGDARPVAAAMFKRALDTPGLQLVFGTDAVALAHGRNAEELICRVKAGQTPMDAITTATSKTAKALGLGDHVGVIAPGMDADIIAMRRDPSKDITAVRQVLFVMRHGEVFSGGR